MCENKPITTNASIDVESSIPHDIMEMALQNTYDFARLMSYYRCAMMEIETKFNVLNEEFSLQYDRQPINDVKTRLKSIMSIHRKLKTLGFPTTVENVENHLEDVAGIRVVCSFLDDVYMLADTFKKQDDITLIREKDYIRHPKESGYRSLHLIVAVPIFLQNEKRIMKAEIQLRTISMDSWASLEHQLSYNKQREIPADVLQELKHCAEISANLDERMNQIRSRVYTSKTPQETFLDGFDLFNNASVHH